MPADPKKNIKVLFVDDSQTSFILVSKLFDKFRKNNYELEWTVDYSEALSAMQKNTHDVYLVDYWLEDKSGLDLVREANELGCCAPVILLTADDNKQIDFEALEAGVSDYLVKNQVNAQLLERSIRYSMKNHQTLQALRGSESRYRNLIETLPVMFYTVEPEPPYNPIYISPAFKIFGYPLEQWRNTGDLWVKVLHPDDRERVLAQTEAARLIDGETNYEYRLIGQDGTVYWVHDRGCFIRDKNGEIICWQGIIFDITERKEAEQEMKKREELYRTLACNIPQTAVLLFDRDFRYTLAEGEQLKRHGFSREKFEGRTLWEVFPPDICEEWSDFYRRALDGEYICREIKNTEGCYQIYVVPVKNEKDEIFAGMVMWQDMTERVKTKDALDESEERFRSFFENAPIGIYRTTPDGRILMCNPTMMRMLGYKNFDELASRNLEKEGLEPDNQRKQFKELIERDGFINGLEYELVRRDGTTVTVRENARSVCGEDGTTLYYEGTVEDITEKRKAEETLKEKEEQYRNLFENANDIVYIHDLEGNYISVNQAAERVFGYTREEILKMHMSEVVAPKDLEIARQKIADKIAGEKQSIYEINGRTKDGKNVTLELNTCGIFNDGKLVAVQGIARDITERKFAEEALRDSEAKFRTVAETASDAILSIDQTGTIIFVNAAAEKIFGYQKNEMIGQNLSLIMPERMREAHQTGILRYMETGKKKMRWKAIELPGLHKNGNEISLEFSFAEYVRNGKRFFTSVIRDVTERKIAEEALKESETRFRNLFENAHDLIYAHDLQGNFTSLNRAGELITGYSRDEALKMNIAQVVAPEYLEMAKQMTFNKLAGKTTSSYELEIIAKNENRVHLELSTQLIFRNGKPIGVQGIARDITERKSAEKTLHKTVSLLSSTLESSTDGIVVINSEGEIVTYNKRFLEMWRIPPHIIEKRSGTAIVDFVKNQLKDPQGFVKSTENLYAFPLKTETHILEFNDGRIYERYSQPQYLEGKPVGRVCSFRDITERIRAGEQLRFSALFDSLTNLPNRTQFMNNLESAIMRAESESEFQFAVLFLDLDRFKVINDGLGHLIGDKLLVAIAERLKSCIRPGDVVARLGGDEFTILVHNVKAYHDAEMVAERILQKLSTPFRVDNYEVFTSASIGIIVSDETRRKSEDFLRDADTAMYRAKETGKARFEIFDREMHIRNMNFLQVETDLRRAIERDEFMVYYQPIVGLNTGEILEFEALIRWQHPVYGMVSPAEFIKVAEETGLIIPIGKWILEESCRQVKEWQLLNYSSKPLTISVNLSAKQLMHPLLTTQVREILEKTELEARFLKLEVTESMVMENSEKALDVLSELSEMGVSLSTDDFGTGYSSLSYLHQFPFQRLKIDRSFVGKMDAELKSEAIVRTILMLGSNLEIEVVAEGIENEQQLWQLRSLGCRLGQGYLFSKPLSAKYAEKLLKEGLKLDFESMEMPFIFTETEKQGILELEEVG